LGYLRTQPISNKGSRVPLDQTQSPPHTRGRLPNSKPLSRFLLRPNLRPPCTCSRCNFPFARR
jgi:hypothetical protein